MGKQKFSRSLKRSICIEYMQSGKSRKEIAMKYNLPSVGTLSGNIGYLQIKLPLFLLFTNK